MTTNTTAALSLAARGALSAMTAAASQLGSGDDDESVLLAARRAVLEAEVASATLCKLGRRLDWTTPRDAADAPPRIDLDALKESLAIMAGLMAETAQPCPDCDGHRPWMGSDEPGHPDVERAALAAVLGAYEAAGRAV